MERICRKLKDEYTSGLEHVMRPGKASDRIHASLPQRAPRAEAREELASPRRPPLSAVLQRAAIDPRSLTGADARQLQHTIGNSAIRRLLADVAPRTNRTGLPDQLKAGVESLSGVAMDDVRVHYNSSKPAQLQASAFTQGSDIFIAPGQAQHLPHEAWHVVQQKQGRVQPTLRLGGALINDDHHLEIEADRKGDDAATSQPPSSTAPAAGSSSPETPAVVQRKVGFEFETGIPVRSKDLIGDGYSNLSYQQRIFTANSGLWKVVADSSCMEFVTEPFNENAGGRTALGTVMADLVLWAGRIPARVATANARGEPGTARVDTVGPRLGTTSDPGTVFSRPLTIRLNTLTDGEVTAAPQATGGVRLEQIPALVDAMVATNIAAAGPQALGQNMQNVANLSVAQINNAAVAGVITIAERNKLLALRAKFLGYQAQTAVTPQNFASSLVAMNVDHASWLFDAKARAVQAVGAHVAGLPLPAPNFDKLTGLLTLVISYLLVGANETQVMDYSKIIAPLMARTNFYSLYNLLSGPEKALFTANFVLTTANLAGTGATAIFTAGFRHGGAVEHGPTRGAWIDSIKRGSPGALFGRKPMDLLSQGSGTTAAENSSSLGSMAQPDTRVTGQRDLAVLELRRLPKDVQRQEWRQMALDIFDMIVALP
jgi:hypothetical protein